MTIDLATQIKCVKREIAMRKAGLGTFQDTAANEIAAMEAVLDTLINVQGANHDIAENQNLFGDADGSL